MTAANYPINNHLNYHAHLYFDQATLAQAIDLSEHAGALFNLKIGRVHQKLVGPHLMWSCQISFTNNDFDRFITWLDQHRNGLSIFVHGVTGDDFIDHTKYAYWLGDCVELNLSIFEKK